MITALWTSLSSVKQIDPNVLTYFVTDVGGEDPAEAYHVQMTQRLIRDVLAACQTVDVEALVRAISDSYQLHVDWCASLIESARVTASAGNLP